MEIKKGLVGLFAGTLLTASILGSSDRKFRDFSKEKIAKPREVVTTRPYAKAKSLDFIQYDVDVLARLLVGEARNCSKEEKIAIAYTVINRASDGIKWNGETIAEAALAKRQYSCFNKNDPNYSFVSAPEKYASVQYADCLRISQEVLSGVYSDPTNGSTNYYNPDGMPKIKEVKNIKIKVKTKNGFKIVNKKVVGEIRKVPEWVKHMKKIGRIRTSKGLSKHIFYKPKG